MMTRKHYIKFARMIAEMLDRSEARRMAFALCEEFGADNPRFDRSRFLKACGLESSND